LLIKGDSWTVFVGGGLREWQVQQLLGWWEEMGARGLQLLGFRSRIGERRIVMIRWGEMESGFLLLLPILLLLSWTLTRLLGSNLMLLNLRSRKLLDSLLCRYNILFLFKFQLFSWVSWWVLIPFIQFIVLDVFF
jgi:hypothetical protein